MPNRHRLAVKRVREDFQRALLDWYDCAHRELPWRAAPGQKPDPYRVWLSEVMLQQTTVKAVIPYFKAFTERWPTLKDLAAASREEIMAAWAGLGYYSRARNLHACAKIVRTRGFPKTESELRALPGLGAYTAAAIAAIAFGQPASVVDANIERVIARLFAIETPLPAARTAIRALAAELTPQKRPGDYAQAMMDLGATLCTPRNPSCTGCPVSLFCLAGAEGKPERFPTRPPKAQKPVRRGDAFVIVRSQADETSVLLRRRKDKGLLGGMMEVPNSAWLYGGEARGAGTTPPGEWRSGRTVKHTFTHFRLELRVFASVRNDAAAAFEGEWTPLDDLAGRGLPTVMRKAVTAGLHALGISWPPAPSQ